MAETFLRNVNTVNFQRRQMTAIRCSAPKRALCQKIGTVKNTSMIFLNVNRNYTRQRPNFQKAILTIKTEQKGCERFTGVYRLYD